MSEQEILSGIRTLLALEENYLGEERTALAEVYPHRDRGGRSQSFATGCDEPRKIKEEY
jgi:hypothetical protein